jgi:hypothetical protein
MFVAARAAKNGHPFSSSTPPSSATTPGQMRHFYGVDAINFAGIVGDGRGQTIAIVDVFDDPNARNDLQHFDSFYGLPDPPSFLKYNQSGQLLADSGGGAAPPTQGGAGNGWQIEESLDFEWAHAIAPAANIALIECNSSSFTSLLAGVTSAASLPNVASVSMSWGASEFSTETGNDSKFTASNVVYLASTGDSGAAGTSYPAASPNVIAVGGTTMHFATGTTDGTYGSESAWNGTGGKLSPFEAKPSYQNSVLTGSARGTPDVSMDADPGTGVAVYDSYDFGNSAPWAQYGGTSLAAPMWSALVAILDQGRATAGLPRLSGRSQALPQLYSAPVADFHDVTSGSNGTGNTAHAGYDTVTGIGTPKADKLLNDLAGITASNKLVFTQAPTTTVAGTAIGGAGGIGVGVQDQGGNTVTGDSSTITLTLNGATFAGGGNTATAPASNGVATFTGLVINSAGTFTLAATDGALVPATSAPFTITAAAATSLVYAKGPVDTTAGVAISPAVVVDLKDQFGNIASADNSFVAMTLASGPGALTGTATVQAAAGVATFSNLILDTVGTYTIQPTDGALAGPVSAAFAVQIGPAAKLVFDQQPVDAVAGSVLSPAVTVDVTDMGGNLVGNNAPNVTLALGTGTFSAASTTTVTAGNGVATFNALSINDPGTYTLTASADFLASANSNPFSLSVVDVIKSTVAAHSVSLTRDPDGQHIKWTADGASGAIPITDPNGLTITGDSGNDTVDFDYTNGNPVPTTLHLNGTFSIGPLQGPQPLADTLVDVGQSTVYFGYVSPSGAAAVHAAILAGYNGGAWNGPAGPAGAIVSPAAGASPPGAFTLGLADSADGIVVGQPASTFEVRYTAVGDANLDRVVNADDAILMSRHWNATNFPAWDVGNFNYDSTINLADATLLQKNWNATVTVAAAAAATSPVSPPATTTIKSATPAPDPNEPSADDTALWKLTKKSRDHRRVSRNWQG